MLRLTPDRQGVSGDSTLLGMTWDDVETITFPTPCSVTSANVAATAMRWDLPGPRRVGTC
ncbi:hypothetical protein GCM10023350_53200 [Nocardioides endophyticus]|uniref:Uncharacterized protein n=1 Tax=Nocardioides endophyticus TaxID=1353775 RepID=A0ABP8ZM87_9ACTN